MKPKVQPEPYLAVPKSRRGPGVLVIHAWWGLNEFFRSVCDRLAREGFVALAPDLYEGQVATSIQRAKELRDKQRREPTYKTLLRAIENLQGTPEMAGPAIGIIGFSMGGYWALWLAGNRPALPICAVTTFYGARGGDYSKSRSAFQGHFAEEDPWVSTPRGRSWRGTWKLPDARLISTCTPAQATGSLRVTARMHTILKPLGWPGAERWLSFGRT